MPLLRAEWWEAHQPLVVFMWIILLVVPFAIVYGAGDTFETVLECIVNDYLTFIVLLFVFYHLDKKAYRKDIAEGRKPDISRPGTEFYLQHFCHLRQQTVPSVQRTILRGERSKRLQFCLSEFLLLCSRH